MYQSLESTITAEVAAHIHIRYGVTLPVVIEQPKQSSFGEMALPIAFQLAKELKRAPKAIATELVEELPAMDGVAKMEVAGNGYINIRLNRAAYATSALAGTAAPTQSVGKIIVEHTNINPNKAAHIGHLRNAILGDTFVRMLRAAGNQVEVQNYIDNTGVQVADVVVGFHYLEKKSTAEVKALAAAPRFDYLCWDLYARTSTYYGDHKEALVEWRAQTLHAIEAGEGELAELATVVADAIVECHLKTMLRLGIVYDVLPRESEILHLQFWAKAFELLKERKAIELEPEGKNKGCWVMRAEAFASSDDEDMDKVIVRSNGTVTYVGKDIAYQMWKFGLLGKDFYYKLWHTYPDGKQLFASSDVPTATTHKFGAGSKVFNVIDSRQSYLQDVVVAGLKALGFKEQAANSIHFSYEMVALSPRTCVELDIQLSDEDKKRPYVEVSGRKGLGVKADDLIDKLIENALREVDARHSEKSEADRKKAATAIAIGALRYFMLKYTRTSVIAFDFQEALSFEGETGPYVLYATIRSRNILKKYGAELPEFKSVLTADVMSRHLRDEDLWQYVLAATRLDSAIEKALTAGEPAHMARYAFQLAQSFTNFYHGYQVIAEQDKEKQVFLLWLTEQFRLQLERALGVLGVETPDFM